MRPTEPALSLLYPQLPHMAAQSLHEHLVVLPIEDLTDLADVEHPEAVLTATGGVAASARHLEDFRTEVVRLAQDFGWPGPLGAGDRVPFDRALTRLLWERMALLPAEAAVPDIWTFLSLVLLPDVAYWRYPAPPGDRVLGTDLMRHVFARLWWRADALRDVGPGPPWRLIDALREDDLLHIFEVRSIGGRRTVARAFAEMLSEDQLSREVVRDAQKRILRRLSIMLLDGLERGRLVAELRAVIEEARQAVEGQLPS